MEEYVRRKFLQIPFAFVYSASKFAFAQKEIHFSYKFYKIKANGNLHVKSMGVRKQFIFSSDCSSPLWDQYELQTLFFLFKHRQKDLFKEKFI